MVYIKNTLFLALILVGVAIPFGFAHAQTDFFKEIDQLLGEINTVERLAQSDNNTTSVVTTSATQTQTTTTNQTNTNNQAFLVGTSPVSAVTKNSATFSGFLDPKGLVTKSYFEYGKTVAFGTSTSRDNKINAGLVQVDITDLEPNTRYYVRHCATNTLATKCGVTTSFVTKKNETTPAVTDDTSSKDNQNTEVDGEAVSEENKEVAIEFFEILVPVPSTFVTLGIQNGVSAMQTSDVVTYEINYENTSNRTLRDGVLYVELPADLNFLDTTRGDYSAVDHAISYEFGVIGIDEIGTIFVTMQVPELADDRVPVIAMVRLVHQNPDNGAREGATAYDVDTRYHTLAEERAEALAASAFGAMGTGTTLFMVALSILALGMIFYYLQMEGYLSKTKREIVYKYVPIPAQIPVYEEKEVVSESESVEIQQTEVTHPPALIDQVYQGHLG